MIGMTRWSGWRIVNNPEYVSANILTDDDVTIQELEDKRIIVIEVPRAQNKDLPVYIGTDPYEGSYFRNGEGDYKCTVEEVDTMLQRRNV